MEILTVSEETELRTGEGEREGVGREREREWGEGSRRCQRSVIIFLSEKRLLVPRQLSIAQPAAASHSKILLYPHSRCSQLLVRPSPRSLLPSPSLSLSLSNARRLTNPLSPSIYIILLLQHRRIRSPSLSPSIYIYIFTATASTHS